MLDAVDAPAGEMTVVLGPGWPGILLHEAVGHGLEADFNRKGVSAFSGRIGQQVASPLCTVIDDGTIASRRGSLNVDDEGHRHAAQCADRERHPARLSAGQAFEPPDGRGGNRQRPPRKLCAHPHAAHDQHLHAGGRERSRGDHPLGAEGPLLRQFRRRPGGYHQRQFRLLGRRKAISSKTAR